MERKIVECVPNFSEGRDKGKIKAITDEIEKVSGVQLLDVDPGEATNRTVVTFTGSPEGVSEAAFLAVKKASEVIDMREHYGAHARMGATDVCPFVPVSGATMEDCVRIANEVGRRIGEELDIPVYLYEEAATKPEWRNLAIVRSGEYEGLVEKLKDPEWKPDYGPAKFNPKTGATVVGAREFLIAYNINLNTTEKKYAMDIAFELREKGRSKRQGNIQPFYYKGEIVRYDKGHFPCGPCDFLAGSLEELARHYKDEHNLDLHEVLRFHEYEYDEKWLEKKPVKVSGKYEHVKAVGWYIEEYNRAQISINFTNYKVTPPHIVVEEARKLAADKGLVVTGCEVVGLIPYNAIMMAGKYYLEKQMKSSGLPYRDVIETAIQSLGLNEVAPFEIEKKVIGLPDEPGPIANLSVSGLIDEVSRASVAPGGGSIAALSGALGAALSSMVANITISTPEYDEVFEEMNEIAVEAQKIKDTLCASIDQDTQAFNEVIAALRLPKGTPEDVAFREKAIQDGYKNATLVPLKTAELCYDALKLCRIVAETGNVNLASDAGTGALVAEAGLLGAGMNVLINFPSIKDEKFVEETRNKLKTLQFQAEELKKQILENVYSRIENLKKK
ncbi:glutamate formimidoyltransferase [bacterium]|nr:glutamate formimidoyltransferase [bacterium]